jgi:hypothetical protein
LRPESRGFLRVGWKEGIAMSSAPSGGSKIQIDSDWKAEAQAEKARLEEKVKAAEATKPAAGPAARPGGPGAAAGPREMPKASVETLVQSIASQAMLYLGIIPDPRSGQRIQHLDIARHHIDTLGVIEEKTKNNLSETESKILATTLYELRQAYIQVATAMREQRRG